MKRIGIYFFCVVALGCVTSSILYRKSEESREIRLERASLEKKTTEEMGETVHLEHSQSQEEVIEVSDSSTTKARFLVSEEDGYLVIYDRVAMKQYDETTILINDLPKRLQEKVLNGLYFDNEEELYVFLENYSS